MATPCYTPMFTLLSLSSAFVQNEFQLGLELLLVLIPLQRLSAESSRDLLLFGEKLLHVVHGVVDGVDIQVTHGFVQRFDRVLEG
jgi:hypothetical protein